MTIAEVVTQGDKRKSLEALRDRLASELDREEEDARVVVQIAKELRAVIAELDAIPKGKGDSAVDEVARKREERRKRASTQAGS